MRRLQIIILVTLVAVAAHHARVWACDCAFCTVVPRDQAARLADFHARLRKVGFEAAALTIALDASDQGTADRTMLALVRQWLELHAEFYTNAPLADVDAPTWQARALELNRLLGQAFRDHRKRDDRAVRQAVENLHRKLPLLDKLVGMPEAYYRIVRLRAVYAAYLASDSSLETSLRQDWLSRQLAEVRTTWKKLSAEDRPEVVAGLFDDVPERIEKMRGRPAADRDKALTDEIAFLDARLAQIDAAIGQHVTASETNEQPPSAAKK